MKIEGSIYNWGYPLSLQNSFRTPVSHYFNSDFIAWNQSILFEELDSEEPSFRNVHHDEVE
jgi:hypothetical protein